MLDRSSIAFGRVELSFNSIGRFPALGAGNLPMKLIVKELAAAGKNRFAPGKSMPDVSIRLVLLLPSYTKSG